MRRCCAAILAVLHVHAIAQTAPVVPPDWAEQTAPKAAAPDQQAIREAVRDTLHDAAINDPPRRIEGEVLRGDRYEKFGREFEEARVPGCLNPDGLKRQPTGIGPFQLAGILAAPFVLVAKLRGKCN